MLFELENVHLIKPHEDDSDQMKENYKKMKAGLELKKDCKEACENLEKTISILPSEIKNKYELSFNYLLEEIQRFKDYYEAEERLHQSLADRGKKHKQIIIIEDKEQEEKLIQLLKIYKKFTEDAKSNLIEAVRELGLYRKQRKEEEKKAEEQQRENEKRKLIESIKSKEKQIEELKKEIEDDKRILNGLESFKKAA